VSLQDEDGREIEGIDHLKEFINDLSKREGTAPATIPSSQQLIQGQPLRSKRDIFKQSMNGLNIESISNKNRC